MSQENDGDSQRFKLAHLILSPLREFTKEAISPSRVCGVGMAESEVIGYARDGATAKVKFIFICEHNSLAKKTTPKCLWCSRFQSLMILSMG